MNREIRELLYRSFDEPLSGEERARLEKALADSESLRRERQQIERLRQGLASAAEESFGPLFATQVMKSIDALERPESSIDMFSGALYRLFRPVAAIAATVAVALVLWNAQAGEKLTPASVLALPENGVEVVWETPLETMLQESS